MEKSTPFKEHTTLRHTPLLNLLKGMENKLCLNSRFILKPFPLSMNVEQVHILLKVMRNEEGKGS